MSIFYQTNEPVHIGDVVSVCSDDGSKQQAIIGGMRFDELSGNVAPTLPVVFIRKTTASAEGLNVEEVFMLSPAKISWKNVSLTSRSESTLFYHGSGDEVRIGDIVAGEAGGDEPLTHMQLGVIESFYDPKACLDVAFWREGFWVYIKFVGDTSGMLIDPYGGKNSSLSSGWEDIYYVRRGGVNKVLPSD